MGILIAIDGVDASGKQTQTELLADRLLKLGKKIRRISFPVYDNPSSTLVKQYLAGEFGSRPEDVNAYAASMLFAADRFSTFRTDWGKDYNDDTIIIADRYVSSNMIHQAGKIYDDKEKEEFLVWLDDLEFEKLLLPRPDVTIFLDMPVESALELMKNRNNKITGSIQKDIHETDSAYLFKAYNSAVDVCEKMKWNRVRCVENGKIRTPENISDEIFEIVNTFTKG